MKLGVLAGRCYYNHAQRDMLDSAAQSLNTPTLIPLSTKRSKKLT
jgi:hypothetical protein